jgi:hypothetical protein
MAMALAACGDDGGGESDADADAVIDAMVSEGATEDEARCFVEEIGSADDAERLFTADDEDLSEGDLARLVEALTACGEAFQSGDDG